MARGQRPFSFPPFSFFHGNQGSSRFFRIRPPPPAPWPTVAREKKKKSSETDSDTANGSGDGGGGDGGVGKNFGHFFPPPSWIFTSPITAKVGS